MASYRLYRLDGAGKITAAEWVEADHDAAALHEAHQRVSDQPSELWERNRLVARIPTGE